MRSSDEIKTPKSFLHDKEIESPVHDGIAMWLFDKLQDKSLIKRIFQVQPEVQELKWSVTLEYPVLGPKNGYVGFWDLHVGLSGLRPIRDREIKDYERCNETPPEQVECFASAYFEVKSKLNVLEAIRQCRYYDRFIPGSENSRIFIVAPQNRNYEKILSQGFGFIDSTNSHLHLPHLTK